MMMLVALLLQAAQPAEPAPPVETASETPVAAPAPPAEAAAPEPTEPKMKKVCRKVIDPRVGTLAARRTECKYVQLD